MKAMRFRVWLKVEKGLKDGSAGALVSNCRRLERHEGDLDARYDADELATMLRCRDPWKPGHGISIAGDLYNGTATLTNAVRLYRNFRMAGDRRVVSEYNPDRPTPIEQVTTLQDAAVNDAHPVDVDAGGLAICRSRC